MSRGPAAVGLAGAAARRVEQFAEAASHWIAMRSATQVTPLLTKIIEETGYAAYLEHFPGYEGRGRLENVQELITVGQNFDAAYDARELDVDDPDLGPLAAFLEQLALGGWRARPGRRRRGRSWVTS